MMYCLFVPFYTIRVGINTYDKKVTGSIQLIGLSHMKNIEIIEYRCAWNCGRCFSVHV